MIIGQRTAGVGLVGAALYATTTPALAHHVMDGQLPATFAQGFLSGIGHPIIGIDHLVFIIGVGLLAGLMGRRLLLPLAFVFGSWGGAAVHLFGLNIPFAEITILVGIALMAVAVIGNIRMPALLTAGLIAAAGVFHGYAYAESIFGAEPTPLYAYLAGFAVIQFIVAVIAASVLMLVQTRSASMAQGCARVAGGAMAGVVMVVASNMVFGV